LVRVGEDGVGRTWGTHAPGGTHAGDNPECGVTAYSE
jgi:hypothetical protein